jgi:hypothetical protein
MPPGWWLAVLAGLGAAVGLMAFALSVVALMGFSPF